MANHASLIRFQEGGKPVTRRGRNFIEFDNGDGSRRFVTTGDPLHFGASQDQEIDTGWQVDTGAWQWRNILNDHQIHSRDIFNVGSLFEWRIGSEWVIIDPQSINWVNQDNSRQQIAIKQAVAGQTSDDVMHFPDAYGAGRHYTLIAHPKRLIKHITIDSLASLPAPTVTGTIHFEAEFTITNSAGVELYLDGVRWARSNNVRVRTANRIEFRDANGVSQWYADAPTATDANDETVAAEYEVQRQGGVYFIRVRVPRDWFLTAAYPVQIDPTFTDGYGGDATTYVDTYLLSGATGSNCGIATTLKITADNYRTLFRFDLSSIAAGSTCNDAKLYTYEASAQAAERNVGVYLIASANRDFIEGTKNVATADAGEPTWNYKEYDTVAWAGTNGLRTETTDYLTPALGSYLAATSDPVGTEHVADLTDATVDDFFGTTIELLLFSDSATQHVICSSDHATTGYRPKLVVDYTAAGGGTLNPSAADNVTITEATAAETGTPQIAASDNITVSDSPSAIVEGLALSVSITPETSMERGVAIYDV